MLLYLLISVGACACFVEGKAPPYLNSLMLVDKAKGYVQKHILSMEDLHGMPLLNDGRRHAAVLFNVIYQGAMDIKPLKQRTKYLELVTSSAPQGYSDPKLVINELKGFLMAYQKMTNEIVQLVNSKCNPAESNGVNTCDDLVQKSIKPGTKLAKEAELLLTAGTAANAFLEMNKQLTTVADDFVPIKYLIREVDAVFKVMSPLAAVLDLIIVGPTPRH